MLLEVPPPHTHTHNIEPVDVGVKLTLVHLNVYHSSSKRSFMYNKFIYNFMPEKYCDSACVAVLWSGHSPCVHSLAEYEPLWASLPGH